MSDDYDPRDGLEDLTIGELVTHLTELESVDDDPDTPWLFRTAQSSNRRRQRIKAVQAELHLRDYYRSQQWSDAGALK